MTRLKTFWSLLLLSFAVAFGSCTEDVTGESAGTDPDDRIASKLVFSSENAVKGELLVYFSEEAASKVEATTARVTRAGAAATRSGIDDFDAVLSDIGVRALSRLFPVDARNEERTRAAGLHRWYVVGFDEHTDLDLTARAMARIAEVSKVEFNQQLMHVHDGRIIPLDEALPAPRSRAQVGFNDPMLGRQWHYINTGDPAVYSNAKAGADVNCDEAWRLCTGDPRVIVAVVDNCVQWDHPDLAANMWVNTAEQKGQDGRDDDSNGYADDVHGYNFVSNSPLTISTGGDAPEHGTHVAGTVAAVNNNGTGVCGIAGGSGQGDGVKIMSCQIFYNEKGGSSEITARAIKYAADNGAAIIQCSYGYPAGNVTSDAKYASGASAEKQAVDYFIATKNCDAISGGLAIFAAGNEMTGMSSYPGAYRDYISVTSISCDYTPAYYTNYGPGCNIAAPGGDAYQSYLENKSETSMVLSTILNGKYGYSQGTSMACPHVSGVAALGLSYALQQGKSFTRSEFTTILLTSVNNINGYCTGSKPYITDVGGRATLDLSKFAKLMGSGYIDAYQVLMNVRGTTCIPVPVGSQYTLDLQPYLGGGNLDMQILKAEIAAEDMTRLGIASAPLIFANKILFKCTNPGSAIIKVSLLAGTGNNSGMNGMTVTKEFALIARESHAGNGGWF